MINKPSGIIWAAGPVLLGFGLIWIIENKPAEAALAAVLIGVGAAFFGLGWFLARKTVERALLAKMDSQEKQRKKAAEEGPLITGLKRVSWVFAGVAGFVTALWVGFEYYDGFAVLAAGAAIFGATFAFGRGVIWAIKGFMGPG